MRGRRHKLQVSTFPFLAVLLCAMGSLILVLLVMDRKAHKAAQARTRNEAARLAEQTARNEADRRAAIERKRQQAKETWEKKRQELHARLSDEQVAMELQMRKVREEMSEIAARLRYEQDTSTQLRRKVQDERGKIQTEQQRLGMLRSGAGQVEAQSKESSKTLQRMTSDLLQMEQALKDLKAARQREQHTFSVVPYHGRRGENRRPIYVECTLTGVIFHPERRAMPIGDAVRGEVERRIARQRVKLAGSTPYLLLLLRPDGVNTYHEFQAVLKGLDLDFGYEFIDADWVLDFPADDEQPSAQPWMVATKTPVVPSSGTGPARNEGTPRPVGMAPSAGPGPPGIRSRVAADSGRWSFRKPANSAGFVAGGNGSGSGGSGPLVLGGVPDGTVSSGTPGGSASGLPGGTGSGQAGSGSGPLSGGGGNGLPGSGNAWGSNRGGGYGHPSALAPSGGGAEGGGDEPGEPSQGGVSGSSSRRPGASAGRGLIPPYMPGAALSGASGSAGSEPASLGPPQALPSGSGVLAVVGSGGSGSGGNGPRTSGSGPPGGGISGSPVGNSIRLPRTDMGTASDGGSINGALGSGVARGESSGSSAGSSNLSGASPEGSYTVGRGSGGSAGQPGVAGVPNSRGTFSPGGGQFPAGTAGATGQGSVGAASVGVPAPQRVGPAYGGGPQGSDGGPPSSAHPTRAEAVYPGVDPLMPRRPRGLRPSDRGEEPPPERPAEDTPPGAPRKKVLVQGGGSPGEPGGSSSGTPNRFATPTYQTARPRKPAGLHPAWVHGGRDWTIYVECLPDSVKLYPSEKTFPLALAAQGGPDNPLVTAIRQMIDRRQAARRPGEPPYYPQVRLLVRPDNVRTFLTVYPALEALPVPKTRQNLDSDDDVADIVTGAKP